MVKPRVVSQRPYPVLGEAQRTELMKHCRGTLSATHALILRVLLDHDGGDELGAYPSHSRICDLTGIESQKTVRNRIHEMTKAGLITSRRGGVGRLRRYYALASTSHTSGTLNSDTVTSHTLGTLKPVTSQVTSQTSGHSKGNTNPTGSRKAGSSQNATRGKQPEKKPGWVAEAGGMWKEVYGGTAAYGEIGKHLKPLVDEHGWDEVKACWARYLEETDGEFTSPAAFAKKFGLYRGDGPTSALRDVDALFAQHQAAGAL